MNDKSHDIAITVTTQFLDQQSAPEQNRYVFAYTITITNRGSSAAQLLARHWIITEADGTTREVHGEGVVGEQPWVDPGEDYQYTSGAVLESAVGTMGGKYFMISGDGTHFEAPIDAFVLAVPRTLH